MGEGAGAFGVREAEVADMRQFTPNKGLWVWKGRLTWGAFNNPEMRLELSPGAGV